ncbi:unnamed protein product [Didymodactylos carnosus]|uniref:Uncharacterized protein n=1 Tax=Didymodactylos carnosus TaxID=1234261 RepID=A0A8S2CPC3_9BILA|nr:unnamed protein product [Didymodactylos carnosus]CAF3522130.1 unnamed protein product [Didymodactylos carnosus]
MVLKSNTFVEKSPEPLSGIHNYTLNDFETYLTSLKRSDAPSPTPTTPVDLSNIPTIFLSSNFSLSNTQTFNLVFPGIGHFQRLLLSPEQQQKSRTTCTNGNISETSTKKLPTNQSLSVTSNGTETTLDQRHQKHSISSTTRLLQDKYTHYLDKIEVQICRELSLKSNGFLDAVKSHDEIHKFLKQTRQAISSLRQELTSYDETSLLTLLKLYRYIRQRQNQYLLLKKLRSLTIVNQTQITVRLLLTTSDYVSALDLIMATREIIQTELNNVHCLRYYDQQLNELNILIVNLMRQEFTQHLENELKKDNTEIIDEDKFGAIIVGLIRVNDNKYLDEINSKFEMCIQQTIDKATKEKLDEMKLKQNKNSDISDQTLSITTDFRYTYPSHNNSYHFSQWKSIIDHVLHESQLILERINLLTNLILDVFQKCLQSKSPDDYQQLKSKYIHQLHILYDSIQDRLIKLFNDLTIGRHSKFPALLFEQLSISDFSTIIHLIQTYTLTFEQSTIVSYRSRPFRTWLQAQTLKFIQHFHDERKQQINFILGTLNVYTHKHISSWQKK